MSQPHASAQDKLAALRLEMKAQGLDGYLVPRSDEYLGEFVAPYAERLEYLTGFTGSAGMAVILQDQAAVLTDARYSLQILQEIDQPSYAVADIADILPARWISKHVRDNAVIGYDPWLHAADDLQKMRETLALKSITLKAVDRNLVDAIWPDQPLQPATPVEIVPEGAAGKSPAHKLAEAQKAMAESQIGALILTQADSIAWLLNIRAQDVEYTPLALSYAVIYASQNRVDWIIDKARIEPEVMKALKRHVDLELIAPAELERHLQSVFGKNAQIAGIDDKRSPVWFRNYLEKLDVPLKSVSDPCVALKAVKNQAEIQSIKQAHIQDGIALVRFLHWIDGAAESGALTEMDVADKLFEFRRESSFFRGLSFPTICGFAGNGAIIHYRARPQTNAPIRAPGLLLVDSGAQYEYGTTDMTRTIPIGKPDGDMIHAFTHVLKGHIAVASAQFPEGATGAQIDALARQPLWSVGLDYAHGTGHGVGFYLGVHEEAASLSPRGHNPIKPGMLLSNEPGFYKQGAFGIRIENLVLAQKMGVTQAGKSMMGFETVSFAPIDRRLIRTGLLTPRERAWIDQYHHSVFTSLNQHLPEDTVSWLETMTKPLA